MKRRYHSLRPGHSARKTRRWKRRHSRMHRRREDFRRSYAKHGSHCSGSRILLATHPVEARRGSKTKWRRGRKGRKNRRT